MKFMIKLQIKKNKSNVINALILINYNFKFSKKEPFIKVFINFYINLILKFLKNNFS